MDRSWSNVLFAAGAVFVVSTIVTPVAAEQPRTPHAAMADEVRAYYASEETAAFTFIGVGFASAAAGSALVTRSGDFERGLGWSLVGVGGLQAIAAATYVFQVKSEIAEFSALLARDPRAFKRKEASHIHGTTSRFVLYQIGEIVTAVAGGAIATYGLASNRDVWTGVGVGVAAQALLFFVLDRDGKARAQEYEDRVRRFEPRVAVHVGGGERPSGIALSTRF